MFGHPSVVGPQACPLIIPPAVDVGLREGLEQPHRERLVDAAVRVPPVLIIHTVSEILGRRLLGADGINLSGVGLSAKHHVERIGVRTLA